MVKSGKIWGETTELIKTPNFEVHRIIVKRGGYCSLHKHNFKNNMFYVERGNIRVDVYKNEYELVDETYLKDGEMIIVKPTEFHKFYGIIPSIVYEIYWLDGITDDIIRKDIGGLEIIEMGFNL